MRVAVLSGKGGTGKTFVSVNLAAAAGQGAYVDCDVEEPNGHLFLKPEGVSEETVFTPVPRLIPDRCDGCRVCVDFCRFNALALVQGKPVVFDDVCHSCGGCVLLCPRKALVEEDRPIGRVRRGRTRQIRVSTGILSEGEASGIPIIKKLLGERFGEGETVFIDCPPGSGCAVVESVREADCCVLVAEPTLYGVHNLQMVHQLVRLLGKPHGAILNKCLEGVNPAETYCGQNRIEILQRIPFDKALGQLCADGRVAAWEDEAYGRMFRELLDRLHRRAAR